MDIAKKLAERARESGAVKDTQEFFAVTEKRGACRRYGRNGER